MSSPWEQHSTLPCANLFHTIEYFCIHQRIIVGSGVGIWAIYIAAYFIEDHNFACWKSCSFRSFLLKNGACIQTDEKFCTPSKSIQVPQKFSRADDVHHSGKAFEYQNLWAIMHPPQNLPNWLHKTSQHPFSPHPVLKRKTDWCKDQNNFQ